MRKIAAAFGALIATLMLSGCAAAATTPTDAVQRFTTAVGNFDVDAAVEYCDATTQKAYEGMKVAADGILDGLGTDIGSLQLLSTLLPDAGIYSTAMSGKEYSVKVTASDLQEQVEGDQATVTGTWTAVVTVDGEEQVMEQPFTLSLIKDGAGWKIDLSSELSRAFSSALGS